MPTDSTYTAPFDTSTSLFPAEWQLLSEMLSGSEVGMLFLQGETIAYIDPYLAQRLGFSNTELAGKPLATICADPGIEESTRRKAPHKNGNTLHNAPPSETTIQLTSKEGESIDFLLTINCVDLLTDTHCVVRTLHPKKGHHPVALSDNSMSSSSTQWGMAIAEHLPELVFLCRPDLHLVYVSPSSHSVLGLDRAAMIEENVLDLLHQEDRPKLIDAVRTLEKNTAPEAATAQVNVRIRHADGTWRCVAIQARSLTPPPLLSGLLLSGRDVSEQYAQQQNVMADKRRQLHYLNRLFRLAQRPHPNLLPALKVILKASAKALGTHRCAYWEVRDDQAATHCVLQYDDIKQNHLREVADSAYSTVLHSLLHQVWLSERPMVVTDVDQDPRAALFCEYFHPNDIKAVMLLPVQRGNGIDGVLMLAHLSEARQWRKEESAFAGHVAGLISLILNEVERTRTEAQLRHLAHHDSLTGLPNRHFLFDQAADIFPKVIARSPALAAFFIDLDGFKNVNDALGHAVGDELLKAVALRLKNVVRIDDILVRLGGDEFMLLARNLTDMRVADDIALQIVETMRSPFALQGHELQISASVGLALYPFDGRDIDTLMKKADIAMYHAKSAGRDRYQLFTPALGERLRNRSALENDLRRALAERELQHYYQPQIDLRTGQIRAVEALLRWIHPQQGILMPSQFLPLAEQAGLMRRISAWVLHDACHQISDWQHRGLGDFNLAINLSASQLMDQSLLSMLEEVLDRTGVSGQQLEWEIKESTVMQHNSMTSSMLDRLGDLDIGLSIDDFGTGQSSLAYLRRYRIQKVKIDQSLINGLSSEGEQRAITSAIISMAKPLGLSVVAEGVETAQQMEYLREQGCHIAQGYYFTHPLTADEFEKWLVRH